MFLCHCIDSYITNTRRTLLIIIVFFSGPGGLSRSALCNQSAQSTSANVMLVYVTEWLSVFRNRSKTTLLSVRAWSLHVVTPQVSMARRTTHVALCSVAEIGQRNGGSKQFWNVGQFLPTIDASTIRAWHHTLPTLLTFNIVLPILMLV